MISNIYHHYRTYLCTPLVCALSMTAVLVATLTGPFGTHTSMTFVERAVFWTIAIALGVIVARGVGPLIEVKYEDASVLTREILSCTVFTVIFAPILSMLIAALSDASTFGVAPSLPTLALWTFLMAASVAMARCAVEHLSGTKAADPTPKLFDRLPANVDGPIMKLTADGHHTLVSTGSEDYRIRLRIADAIGEMDGTAGVVVHRSHWVNKDAVAGVERDDKGKMWVLLPCGKTLPVSKKREQDLEDLLAPYNPTQLERRKGNRG